MSFSRFKISSFCIILLIILLVGANSFARNNYNNTIKGNSPKVTANCREIVNYAVHNVGKIGFTVSNMGNFGKGFLDNVGMPMPGDVPSFVYPYPGQNNHLFAGALWVGAVVGQDTLVSVGADGWSYVMEMWPAPDPEGRIIHSSINDPYRSEAYSEQDFISVYTDTVTDPSCVDVDPFDNRPHLPLNLRITQRSYAWSYPFAEDFIIFDYTIKNIGQQALEEVYMGIYVDGDVGQWDSWDDAQDDICGFRRTIPAVQGCSGEDWLDTVNIAWMADNDGKRFVADLPPCPDAMTLTDVTGIRILATPSDSIEFSYNWWISNSLPSWDWGPRLAGTPENPFRDFSTGGLGTPMGDKNKHYIMRNDEFDYDILYTGVDHTGEGWLPPPYFGPGYHGFDIRYLLSFGPFNIQPGENLPIIFAYVAGEDFHTDCNAFEDLLDAQNPDAFANYLNFNDLGTNAMRAAWIFDNPGIDTDGDGYKGPKRYCVLDSVWVCDTIPPDSIHCYWDYSSVDTIYTAGDGVPDFSAGIIPPCPYTRLEPISAGIRARWNGFHSETTRDLFTGVNDTEGYRLHSTPDTMYGFIENASYYLISSDPTDTAGIHKRFPAQPYPTTLNIDSAIVHYPDEVITEGNITYFKYFEYEYFLRNLIPGYGYCIGVTAFDPYSESRVKNCIQCATPLDVTNVDNENTDVLPGDFAINQNFPNPFNPATSIEYTLPSRSHVTISVYNLLGRKISTIVDEVKPLGLHTAVWDGRDDDRSVVASGIYFYQIQAGDFVETKKMLLLK